MRWLVIAMVMLIGSCGRSDLEPSRPSTAPSLTLDQAALLTSTDTATFAGTCTTGIAIDVDPQGQTTCVRGRFSLVVTATVDGPHAYTFTQGRAAVAGVWTRDTVGPLLLAETRLASGATVTRSRFPALHARATDTYSEVAAFCARVDDTLAPLAADPCWVNVGGGILTVPRATDVTVDSLPAELGFISGTYTARVWARDALGNIGAAQALTIEYRPVPPPTLRDVFGTNAPGTGGVPEPAELTVAQGQSVYVSWYAAADGGLAASPIRIYTTSDDVTYTAQRIDIANGANDGCNVPAGATGCAVLAAAPASTYFRVRVIASDTEGYASAESSPPLNAAPMSVIAGAVDGGLDASVTSAMLFAYEQDGATTASQATVIRRDGTLYYRDLDRGILWASPKDGVLRVLIPRGPAIVDGPVDVARVVNPIRLTIDANDNLLLLDDDRVRMIDLATQPPVVTTLIGGGSQTTDGTLGLDFALAHGDLGTYASSNLVVLPNGDIWFQSSDFTQPSLANGRIRIYDGATRVVRSLAVSGTGDTYDAATNLAACSIASFNVAYDPATSAVDSLTVMLDHNIAQPSCSAPGHYFTVVAIDSRTGAKLADVGDLPGWGGDYRPVTARDGGVYVTARGWGFFRLDVALGVWGQVIGQGGNGDCADGTPADACPVDLNDAFVDPNGQVYFQSRNRIRVIGADGAVHTIAGQQVSAGDGGRPTSARFGRVDVVHPFGNGYMVLDVGNGTFRRIADDTVERFAGNGTNAVPNSTDRAVDQPLGYNNYGRLWTSFGVGPGPTLYYSQGDGYVSRIVEPADPWTTVVGNTSSGVVYNDPSANGQPGTSINLIYPASENHPPRVLGIANQQLLTQRDPVRYIDTVKQNVYFTSYNLADQARQSTVSGVNGDAPGYWCAPGTPLTSCATPSADAATITQATWWTTANAWLMAFVHDRSIRKLALDANATMQEAASVEQPIMSLVYRGGANETVYYCAQNGHVYQRDLASALETELPWTIPSASCVGLGMVYESTTQSLVIPYRANHMYGLVRLTVP